MRRRQAHPGRGKKCDLLWSGSWSELFSPFWKLNIEQQDPHNLKFCILASQIICHFIHTSNYSWICTHIIILKMLHFWCECSFIHIVTTKTILDRPSPIASNLECKNAWSLNHPVTCMLCERLRFQQYDEHQGRAVGNVTFTDWISVYHTNNNDMRGMEDVSKLLYKVKNQSLTSSTHRNNKSSDNNDKNYVTK